MLNSMVLNLDHRWRNLLIDEFSDDAFPVSIVAAPVAHLGTLQLEPTHLYLFFLGILEFLISFEQTLLCPKRLI